MRTSARTGCPSSRSKIGFQARPKAFCGRKWGDAAGRYCDSERRFMVLLDKGALADSSNLYLYLVIAHEFGHHLQNLTGMSEAYRTHPTTPRPSSTSRSAATSCRPSAWPGCSSGRCGRRWAAATPTGSTCANSTAPATAAPTAGARTCSRWLDGGFATRRPGACNTWTARVGEGRLRCYSTWRSRWRWRPPTPSTTAPSPTTRSTGPGKMAKVTCREKPISSMNRSRAQEVHPRR